MDVIRSSETLLCKGIGILISRDGSKFFSGFPIDRLMLRGYLDCYRAHRFLRSLIDPLQSCLLAAILDVRHVAVQFCF